MVLPEVWPLTWSHHHSGMWPTSLGPGHPWILFWSGDWLFMEFLIPWAPLRSSFPQPSSRSGSIFLSFSHGSRHWGALLTLLLSISPSSSLALTLLYFSIQKISSIFCCHLFPKSDGAEETYFCPTHFTRFIWHVWPNHIPDYTSFPLNSCLLSFTSWALCLGQECKGEWPTVSCSKRR